ncbi:alpha/beta hydrolase [Dietzia kunjamensis]|uniref:lipase family protein n=1 Tax=Dietzia kunjamensis TaxID=322509 RepID=UPI002DBE6BDF|nr:lipase family protein [Dietzia kunjamensis]MEB8324659.1 alpha/beta hydrolase [Dietzia kunjamensis]
MRDGVGGHTDRGRLVVGVLLALAAIALGSLLILVHFGVPVIVSLAGVGLVVVGLATVTGVDGAGDTGRWARLPVGLAAVAAGIVVLVWRSASIRNLLWVMVATLIVHGIHTLVGAVRGDADRRVAGVFSGAAAVLLGVLCLVWPVLAIELVRYAVGAWLVFVGLGALVEMVLARARARAGERAHAGRARLRRWGRTIGAAVVFVVVVALAVVSALLLRGDERPGPDAFYTPVEPLPDEPGILLRAEILTVGVPAEADAWRILYTTTRPDGTVTAASGTVIAPAERDADALPLLSVAHGTTGIVPRCAPSLSTTPFADGAGTALEEMVTDHGWAGVTSDYVGLGTSGMHPYLVGQAEARNVLDASRAAQQLDGLTLSTDTVVWGHSQGGHGALWTGQIAGDYAPELTLKGIAGMAPATDLFDLAEASKSQVAGKTVSAYIARSWNVIYPELDLSGHLNPGTAHGVEKVGELCFNEKDVIAALLRGSQIPEQVFPDAVLDGDLGETLRGNSPAGPWPAPVLIAQGLADPLVKPTMQQNWVEARCADGERIDYRTYPGLDHNGLVAADSPLTPQLVQWTLDRWDGAAPTPTC